MKRVVNGDTWMEEPVVFVNVNVDLAAAWFQKSLLLSLSLVSLSETDQMLLKCYRDAWKKREDFDVL